MERYLILMEDKDECYYKEILLKIIYRFNSILIKILMTFSLQ